MRVVRVRMETVARREEVEYEGEGKGVREVRKKRVRERVRRWRVGELGRGIREGDESKGERWGREERG